MEIKLNTLASSSSVQEDVQTPKVKTFPNLALEIMKLCTHTEDFQTTKLRGYKEKADGHEETIKLLMDLSTLLPHATSDGTSYELKPETKTKIIAINEQLKAKGFDIFPNTVLNKELSQGELLRANSSITGYIESNKRATQGLFVTDIPTLTQFMSMINDVAKKIIERNDQLIRKTAQLQH